MSSYLLLYFFFFSSRRRHTRSLCDWSSDVCSSDLPSDQTPVAPAEKPSAQAAVARAEKPSEVITLHQKYLSRSEEHTSELQSHSDLVCRLLLEKKKKITKKKEEERKNKQREHIRGY